MFDYLYYRFYLLGKLVGNQDEPKSKAMYMFMVFQAWNLLTLLILFERITKLIKSEINPVYGIPASAIVIFLNFILLYKRHNSIAKKFELESNQQKKMGFILLTAYIIISIFSFFLVLPTRNING
jgi:hypothetical protein